jgi:CheY-like chemotaxis protein
MSKEIRILVVDDEFPAIALEDIAQATGARIDLVRSEREARERFLQDPIPDLILMDGYLEPNRDRPRDTEMLVRGIRREGYRVPMVAISGDEDVSRKLVAAGCDALWIKTESVRILKDWIRTHAAQ